MHLSCYDIGSDQELCTQRARQWGCGWRTGTTECAPPTTTTTTASPGCCGKGTPSNRQSYRCEGVDEKTCAQWAHRADCEWRVGDDPFLCADPTAAPTAPPVPTASPSRAPIVAQSGCPSNHRHRKSWAASTEAERQLFITGFRALAEQGVTQQFTACHLADGEHSNSEFLPWHREFVYQMENAIRSLGGDYECFAMPYWDWSSEPTPDDVAGGAELLILNSGLGGDGDGQCLADELWGETYVPFVAGRTQTEQCLIRDLDYAERLSTCTFYSASQVMDLIDYSPRYQFFRPFLEGSPHPLIHVCFGGDALGDMGTLYSPNDPVFFLHHCFVDLLWALWQNCYGYDVADTASWSDAYDESVHYLLRFDDLPDFLGAAPKAISETFDLYNDYDVSYEKGSFWGNAFVDDDGNCGRNDERDPINPQWFYDEDGGGALDSDGRRSERSSNAVAAAIWRNLKEKYPDAPNRDVVAEWAEEVCLYEQMRSGLDCPVPDELPNCEHFAVDPATNDIVATLAEMVDPAVFALTECQNQTRQRMFEWAAEMHQLRYLCEGCFDPICQRRGIMASGRCLFDSMEHDQDGQEAVDSLLGDALRSAKDAVAANLQIAVIVAAAALILVARRCLEQSERNELRMKMDAATSGGLGYGAVY